MLEDGKKLSHRLTGMKKLRKDQCLIVILLGVLLCVISLPVEKSSTKSAILDNVNDRIGDEQQTFTDSSTPDSAKVWEEKLEESLV